MKAIIFATLKTPEVAATNAVGAAGVAAPWILTDWSGYAKAGASALIICAIVVFNVAKAIGAVVETTRLVAGKPKKKSKRNRSCKNR